MSIPHQKAITHCLHKCSYSDANANNLLCCGGATAEATQKLAGTGIHNHCCCIKLEDYPRLWSKMYKYGDFVQIWWNMYKNMELLTGTISFAFICWKYFFCMRIRDSFSLRSITWRGCFTIRVMTVRTLSLSHYSHHDAVCLLVNPRWRDIPLMTSDARGLSMTSHIPLMLSGRYMSNYDVTHSIDDVRR